MMVARKEDTKLTVSAHRAVECTCCHTPVDNFVLVSDLNPDHQEPWCIVCLKETLETLVPHSSEI